ncbi:MAG: YajQ family cyclic di-GMP-binding protein [Gammaproteobacteria bacterium]|nr:YajQ family cyclic di-GMP-binding protein [Gammaproteobacteria bacterium]NND38758.1 YajQ family cyclic di-GMP-binding protein [Pseudomonadales bacterium]MBT8151462.1 YajQ family cyclic di-GMP-binding protein [Gammaproteobacteria bacterium]NNL10516.1 YajQ family cyclic di-GMP-binding protein [Pseudomonadales bacterium]NNM10390.1 YajQ family cyclic di-GMP-binding protein [Pseudomonadales bacterium]
MPSFDVVSEVDIHQAGNAVDQANRVVSNRFDFKGVDAKFEREERVITIVAEAEFQVQQMVDMLQNALHKCDIDIKSIEYGDIQASGKQCKQQLTLRHGIASDTCKKIVKMIKAEKFKVQAQIQAEQVRISGKKRDDLQAVIGFLKAQKLDIPLQFVNFRD